GIGWLALQQERPADGLYQTAGHPHGEGNLFEQGPGPFEELPRLVEAPEVRLEAGLTEQRGGHGLPVPLGPIEDLATAANPFLRGCRADPRSRSHPCQTLGGLTAVSGSLGVLDCLRPGLLGRR